MRVTPVRHCRPRAFTRSARGPAGPSRGRVGGGGVAGQRAQRRGAAARRRARLGGARGARAAGCARPRGAAPGGARGGAGGAWRGAGAAARRARQGAAVRAAAGAGTGARAGPGGRGAAHAGSAAARAARAADAHRGGIRGARPCARRPPPWPRRGAHQAPASPPGRRAVGSPRERPWSDVSKGTSPDPRTGGHARRISSVWALMRSERRAPCSVQRRAVGWSGMRHDSAR